MPVQQPEGVTAADVDRTLQAVLARPEYAPPQPSPLSRWVESAVDWFLTDVWPGITGLFPVPDPSAPGWRTLGVVVLAIGALAGLVVLLLGSRAAVRWWRHRGEDREAEGASRSEPLTAVDLEVRARSAAERGEWRSASHALYQATLLRLGKAGMLRFDGSKTPGDYRRETRSADAPIASDLDHFLRWFERVAYGREEPGAHHYARLTETASALTAHG